MTLCSIANLKNLEVEFNCTVRVFCIISNKDRHCSGTNQGDCCLSTIE